MKKLRLPLLALAATMFLTPIAQAVGFISFFGYEINQPRWRSTDFAKSITLAPTFLTTTSLVPNHYGQSGWILPGLASDLYLPSFAPLAGITAPGTLSFTSATYASNIDDPTATISGSVAALPASFQSIAYQTPGVGAEANLYNFTLSGAIPSSFLISIAFGNLANPAENAFGAASYRAGINGGAGTGQLTAITNDSQIDWIFFRVDDALAGDTINLYGTAGAAGLASVAIVAFDPIPEPSAMALMGVALTAMTARRRRSAA